VLAAYGHLQQGPAIKEGGWAPDHERNPAGQKSPLELLGRHYKVPPHGPARLERGHLPPVLNPFVTSCFHAL
jgi:hypothetical protein